MSLSSYSISRPVTTVAATIAVVLLGSVSLTRLPVSLLPDVTLPVLTVRTAYPGSAATEVSRFVAEPLEQALSATPGLLELRSVSRNGEATTTAHFAWGTDMASTVLRVREQLDNAREALPDGAERPTLLTSDPGERPIAVLALTGEGDLRSLARTALDVHSRRLEQLDGVASVAVVGAPEDEIRVDVDPERMRALGLSPEEIATAIRSANQSAPGGTIRRGQFRFSVRALTEFTSPEQVGMTPIGPAGSGIQLADVATVHVGAADPRTLTRLDGVPAVGLVVYKDAGSNTVQVTEGIMDAIGALESEFPQFAMTLVAAQADFVTAALGNLVQEIVLGGILSLLVILLFLRDWRSSLAIGLIVPLSILMALVVLQMLDVSINILSLGGLALGVGLLVDNAIVVAEATGRLREQGMPVVDAARQACSEVSGPLIAGTLTTLLVFGPIVFVRGLAAALFRDLSLSVVTSLAASLVLALTLMPVMIVGSAARRLGASAGRSSRRAVEPTSAPDRLDRLSVLGARVTSLYDRGMRWSLVHPREVFGIAFAAVVITALVALRLPREILPQVDEGTVVAELRLPEGTAIETTTEQTARVEAAARELGATDVYARVGLATDEEVLAGADPGTSATAQILIPVPDGTSADRFAEGLRAAVPDLASGALALDLAGQSEFGSLIGREGRLVRVEISAARADEAERFAATVRAAMDSLPRLADVRDAYAGTQPQVEIALERERIAERGISVDAVADALAGGLGGVEASELRETDRRTPIRVRLAGSANENLAAALRTPVEGIPVGQLVSVEETRAPVEVVRVGQRPVAVVEAVVESGGTARASREVREALERVDVPAGMRWEVTGADEEQQRTTRELLLVAVLSVALVFLVLAGEFSSFSTPLVVMLTVPLAGAGGILLLWLTGQSLNAVSLIGIIVMIGIADNDAVVKLDAIRRFRAAGHGIDESVILGGHQRLRAIAMTSLTTVTGVLPLVFGLGSGGELYQPLAAGVIGGSVSATLVTFFLLPTAYAVVERRAARRQDGKTARRIDG
ncbi:MAG TPA: efflux RND transporter permease subunit [Gemmatimonadales bacterium]|nr:efflux RND transporter permease subunit [Gemmatimonadales bacterium]